MSEFDPENPIYKVNLALTRIEGKLDTSIATQEKHDNRISAVEKKVWVGSGLAIGLGVLWEAIKSKVFHVN